MSASPRHGGGLAARSIRHPIGVSMIALAVVILGLFSLGRLAVDLLPNIIYPEIRVRVSDPGVPARIMEDRITRQLEEQLAITEGAIGVQSRSTEGNSNVDLAFGYGTDIDLALRDASTRLDRAKRFLPDSIDPPTIYKRDPSQIPVLELVVSSAGRDSVSLRDWVDYDFSKQFLTLPGVASVEVGGGLLREVQVLPDPARLSAVGLTLDAVVAALKAGNVETPAGRLTMERKEFSGRTVGRFRDVSEIAALALVLPGGDQVRLDQVAQVLDTHSDERIRVRLDGIPGVKVSIQKQPSANTVEVVDAVRDRLGLLAQQRLIPADVTIREVSDQAVHVRNALNNATAAAASGTLLAMAVVYLFLGNLRRTLIVGSAIPLAVMVTFVLMDFTGLTFNIMTLGGLALGIGMLVDNTIVMLENIHRHQRAGEQGPEAGENAAHEINSAIVASTSTNLAAVLPFLFIGGLVGLLFQELIITISAAILASMVVALTLVPALGVKVRSSGGSRMRDFIDRVMQQLQGRYSALVGWLLAHRTAQAAVVLVLGGALAYAAPGFLTGAQQFLPEIDDGQLLLTLTADPGVSLEEMDRSVRRVESLLEGRPEVQSVFATVGGFIFGRTEREMSNSTTLTIQLVPRTQRPMSSTDWIRAMNKTLKDAQMAGVRARLRARGIRGVRVGSGDDDVSLRIQGPDLLTLATLADDVVSRLKGIDGLSNVQHSSEEQRLELAVRVDRARASVLGVDPKRVGDAVQLALNGSVVTDFFDDDRSYDVRVRLPRRQVRTVQDMEDLPLFVDGRMMRLREVARVELANSPSEIMRDNQRRVVEISGTIAGDVVAGDVHSAILARLADFVPPAGYALYDGGAYTALQEGRQLGGTLLGLALFLVFVVMAVQYESLRNPFVILLSVPFSVIGVALALKVATLPLSMPVWLGMIMLAGIVVNNAIVLVEYVEIARGRGVARDAAIVEAARLRLRPILMTTLTTVFGMLPLAIGLGQGAELLQPLAVSLIGGLLLSLLVTLALVPILYRVVHWRAA